MIRLNITDAMTGEVTLINLKVRDAHNLYQQLREVVGDMQYQAKPGELVTLPDAQITVPPRVNGTAVFR